MPAGGEPSKLGQRRHIRIDIMRTLAIVLAVSTLVALPAVASGDGTTFIAGDQVRAAFEKGRPLVETDLYKVHASRREGPGMAEIHERDTDIIYVLEGTATLVTGGTAVDLKTVAPGELRGARIDGGTPQALAKGDVFIVPNGVAHQFTVVQAPFLYYVVKATAPAGGSR
jgi:mannose-6-phosphate isomerase-like protein (cupin superfamily)